MRVRPNLIHKSFSGKNPWGEIVNNIELDDKKCNWNPRNVRFWECYLMQFQIFLFKTASNNESKDKIVLPHMLEKGKKDSETEDIIDDFKYQNCLINDLESSFFLYEKFNKRVRSESFFKLNSQEKFFEIYSKGFKDFDKPIFCREIHVDSKRHIQKNKFSIAIVNSKLSENYLTHGMRGTPVLNDARRKCLESILDQSSDVDMLVMPECFVPFDYLDKVIRWSQLNQKAVILGLEHWNVGNIIYNFIVTLLPVEIEGIKDVIPIFRLKNFYSPHEELTINGENFCLPKRQFPCYDLFNWRGVYFAPYDCYELANSVHRSIFRSKVDLIIAAEWNKDTNYFSNIVDSLTRDLHVYVVQVNTSEFGDSRVTMPSDSASKDIIKLKGGDNDTVIVGSINIDSLREFQRKKYSVTRTESKYKPLPPDFDQTFVLKRINNEFMFNK